MYNVLPTASKKNMDTFESDWKQFNLSVMREAKAVSKYQAFIPSVMIQPHICSEAGLMPNFRTNFIALRERYTNKFSPVPLPKLPGSSQSMRFCLPTSM